MNYMFFFDYITKKQENNHFSPIELKHFVKRVVFRPDLSDEKKNMQSV